jgi:hypothetical protein
MDQKNLDKTLKSFNNKLNKLVNTVYCIICSKLMYPDQIHNIKKTNENIDFIKLIFNYNGITNFIENLEQLNSCTTCFNFIKQRKLIYVYNNFGDIPRVINSVIECNNYYLINKLCLITMYCKTLNTIHTHIYIKMVIPKCFKKILKISWVALG